VVLEYDVFDVIAHIHDVLLHAGKHKTDARIHEKYHGINRQRYKFVFLQHYQLCVCNKLSQSRGLLHPIIVNNVWERV